MSELHDLYQSVILDHNRSPRNHRTMADANRVAAGRNPLCGDEITVWLRVDDERVADVSFQGKGCAISQASASMMTQAVKGKSRAEALALFDRFHALVTGKAAASDVEAELGRLVALGGVARFPIRVKCASLGWHAFRTALERGAMPADTAGAAPAVSTE